MSRKRMFFLSLIFLVGSFFGFLVGNSSIILHASAALSNKGVIVPVGSQTHCPTATNTNLSSCIISHVSLAKQQPNTLVQYTNTPGSIASTTYTVSVNGQAIFVEQYKNINYARFAFSGSINITITAKQTVSSYKISPKSYNIQATKSGNTVSFSLTQPRKLLITINSLSNLLLFTDPLEVNPPQLGSPNVVNVMNYVTDNTGATPQTTQIQQAINDVSALNGGKGGVLYFPDGKYLTGSLTIKSNVTIYLKSGALIQATSNPGDFPNLHFLFFDHASNAKIIGRGVIDGNGKALRTVNNTSGQIFLIETAGSSNLDFEDVVLRDSGFWTMHILGADAVTISNIKEINDMTLKNIDGIDPDSATNVTVDNVFLYTEDDCFAIKTSGRSNILQPVNNILIQNSVCWTKHGGLKVGTESKANFSNITYQNNDVVNAVRAMYLVMDDGAAMQAITFSNNRSETITNQLLSFIIGKRNGIGTISNITVDNFTAASFSPNNSTIYGYNATHEVTNVAFHNLIIAGALRMSLSDAKITTNAYVSNITFGQ